jgi:hypothetical protein
MDANNVDPPRRLDAVNGPPHYRSNGVEAIEVIEAFGLGFNLGNTVKYVLRAGRKGDAIEDLEKGLWYLQREIWARKAAAKRVGG